MLGYIFKMYKINTIDHVRPTMEPDRKNWHTDIQYKRIVQYLV